MDNVTIQERPNKGRALIAARNLHAGQTVLSEAPILLTPSIRFIHTICSCCLRYVDGTAITCSTCNTAKFCSAACHAASSAPHMHSPWLCRCLTAAPWSSLAHDDQDSLYYILQVCALKAAAAAFDPVSYSLLAQLQSLGVANTHPSNAHVLWGALETTLGGPTAAQLGVTASDVAGWLSREQVNSFGVMVRSSQSGGGGAHVSLDQESRQLLRGSALYPTASMVNHDCLPNAARFDYFDNGTPSSYPPSTHVHLRMLHALPAGEEVTTSYFPLDWDLDTRQKQCREQYGFVCTCPRCQLEQQWQQEQELSNTHTSPTTQQQQQQVDDQYLMMFLLKFVCPVEECGGTLAPVAPGDGQGAHECNVCGRVRSAEEFMQQLQDEDEEEGGEDIE